MSHASTSYAPATDSEKILDDEWNLFTIAGINPPLLLFLSKRKQLKLDEKIPRRDAVSFLGDSQDSVTMAKSQFSLYMNATNGSAFLTSERRVETIQLTNGTDSQFDRR